jgi:hypothetical protein
MRNSVMSSHCVLYFKQLAVVRAWDLSGSLRHKYLKWVSHKLHHRKFLGTAACMQLIIAMVCLPIIANGHHLSYCTDTARSSKSNTSSMPVFLQYTIATCLGAGWCFSTTSYISCRYTVMCYEKRCCTVGLCHSACLTAITAAVCIYKACLRSKLQRLQIVHASTVKHCWFEICWSLRASAYNFYYWYFIHAGADEEYCAAHIAGVLLRFEELITAQQQQQQAQFKPLCMLLPYSTIRSGERTNTIRHQSIH